jgi:hypothetical protein
MILKGALVAWFPVAISMVVHGFTQAVSNGYRAWFLRRHIVWPVVGSYLQEALVALALFALFPFVPPASLVYLGLGVLPFVGWILPEGFRPDVQRPAVARATGFLVNGTQLVAGVAGPLLDLAFLDGRLRKEQGVATKAMPQTLSYVAKFAAFSWILDAAEAGPASLQGGDAGAASPELLVVAAAVWGNQLGGRILARIDERQFRRWGCGILTALGAAYLVLAFY